MRRHDVNSGCVLVVRKVIFPPPLMAPAEGTFIKEKMMDFKIRYVFGDEVGVIINNKCYVYLLDVGFVPKIENLAKKRPGKALNFLKEVSREYIKEGGD